MKKRFIIFYVATFFVVAGLFFAMPASSAILFYEDFEDALKLDEEWHISGGHGSQGLTTEQIRHGSKSYKFSLTRYDSGDFREELSLWAKLDSGKNNFIIGNEYWIGFSIFLADGYKSPVGYEYVVHHQYHSVVDKPPTCDWTEGSRNPILTIETKNGDWIASNQWDSQLCTPLQKVGVRGTQDFYGAFSTGHWYDFVINIKWSYGEGGFLKIWKNGDLVTDRTGGNCFNDVKGPYMKIGIYTILDQDQTMTIYYDELRIGDSSSSYSEVTPGGSALPTVTTQSVADITTMTAMGHGTITNTGGVNATKRGICWNITGNPTVADDKVEENGNFSTGAFSGGLTGLVSGQHYYVKACAYNTAGYGYGAEVDFITSYATGISQAGWSLHYVDSEETVDSSGNATNSFDGNINTMWHTEWVASEPPYPHEIQINLGASYDITGFNYIPRQDGNSNGRISQYEFYVSTDGATWGTPASNSTFVNDASVKIVNFSSETGQYVRMKGLNEVSGNPWASMAELNVLITEFLDHSMMMGM
jgi:hypothetical protein